MWESTGDDVFVAMDFVEGTTLTEWLLERSRPWRQILEVLVSAGQGLAAAHKAGIIHRDFKPDNVLIGRDSSCGCDRLWPCSAADGAKGRA